MKNIDILPSLARVKALTTCPLLIQDAKDALSKGTPVSKVIERITKALSSRVQISFRIAWEQGQVYKNRIKRDNKKK